MTEQPKHSPRRKVKSTSEEEGFDDILAELDREQERLKLRNLPKRTGQKGGAGIA